MSAVKSVTPVIQKPHPFVVAAKRSKLQSSRVPGVFLGTRFTHAWVNAAMPAPQVPHFVEWPLSRVTQASLHVAGLTVDQLQGQDYKRWDAYRYLYLYLCLYLPYICTCICSCS